MVEKESKMSCFRESASNMRFKFIYPKLSKLRATQVVAMAGFRLTIIDCQAFLRRRSICLSIRLSIGSLRTPISSKDKSVDLDTWEKAASSLGTLFHTTDGSSPKGNCLLRDLEKNGFFSGSCHSQKIVSEITE